MKKLKTVGKFLKNVGYGFVNPGSAFKKVWITRGDESDFDSAAFAGQAVGCLLFGGTLGTVLIRLGVAENGIENINNAWNSGDIALRSRVNDHWFTNNNEWQITEAENFGPSNLANFNKPSDDSPAIYTI